jgi:hypothetical protein
MWSATWCDGCSDAVIETGPTFAEVNDGLDWARHRCGRVFVDVHDDPFWAGSDQPPLHPLLGTPLRLFEPPSEEPTSTTSERRWRWATRRSRLPGVVDPAVDAEMRAHEKRRRQLRRSDAEMLRALRSTEGFLSKNSVG